MANRFQKLIYFLSAETPILIVFAVVWLIEKSTWTKPVSVSWKVPILLIVSSALLSIAFDCLFKYAIKNLQTVQVTGADISGGDAWIIAYIISYMLPLASFKFGEVINPVLSIVIAVLLVALTYTDYITPHPLLYIKGYKFYKFDVEGAASGYYLISKKKIRKAADVNKVAQVFDFLLIRVG
jgi:hypothetical protein